MRRGANLMAESSSRTRLRQIRAAFSQRDQYGNWAGGGGYTIRQGLRVGVSGYRGPYLDRKYAYYFPGEANPSKLPAHAIGIDGNWAHGHTTAFVEVQRFVMPYTLDSGLSRIGGIRRSEAGSSAALVCRRAAIRWRAPMRREGQFFRNRGWISPGPVSAAEGGIRVQTLQLEQRTRRSRSRNSVHYHIP